MKKIINPNLLADETGVKNSMDDYICNVCGKKMHYSKIQCAEWYYKINAREKDLVYPGKNKIGYIPVRRIVYICNKHYKMLPKNRTSGFVEIGLPFFISRIGENGGIFSF